MIKQLDLAAQYSSIRSEIGTAVQSVLDTAQFVGGTELAAFEEEFAEYCGVAKCAGVGNGTDAITLSLRALGIGPGAEVILPSHTYFATAAAVFAVGATPVLAEIIEETLLIDPVSIESKISDATRAIIVVHLYGQPCEMDRINEIATAHGVQAHKPVALGQGKNHHSSDCLSVHSISVPLEPVTRILFSKIK